MPAASTRKVQTETRPGARMIDTDLIPWTEFPAPGVRFKLLNLDDVNDGLTMLMQVDEGVQMPIHRHLGAVQVFTLAGRWSYDEGEIGPRGYGYEPNGVVHEPSSQTALELLIVANGPVANLDDDGNITAIIDNDVLFDLAKNNKAIGHLPPRYGA
jgi:2,4'-dihydroxyacetophenone dioxygenase